MARTRSSRPWVALGIAALIIAASCSSDEPDDDDAEPRAVTTFAGLSPEEVVRPPVEGKGIIDAQPAAPLPDGYVEEEFFIAGTATSFESVDTPEDGTWTVAPDEEAEYRTRVVVHRPADAAAFSGTVVIEWFNVSAIESAPDWAYLSEEIGRGGHAYIGVSAQAQGVEGGETILSVDVDEDAAAGAGVDPDTSGLKNIDPERYGTLVHPGDAYSFDIFAQAGRAATANTGGLLGDHQPELVLAAGESQSAFFLSTVANALHPIDPVFDGFLIHSRGANVVPMDGDLTGSREGQDRSDSYEGAVRLRTDLDVPILIFEAETDLTLLGYSYARQPDTDLVRTWEVAGTAHADAHTLRSLLGGPRDPNIGSLLGCDYPINAGPHHEVLQAAFHHLVAWVAGGPPPPTAERLDIVESDDPNEVAIVRDDQQIAIGGVRNPLVDVPVAAYIGDPPGGVSVDDLANEDRDICTLFGQTIPFDQATLLALHGSADAYLDAFRASAAEAVAAGFLLQGDADQLIAEAETNRALFG